MKANNGVLIIFVTCGDDLRTHSYPQTVDGMGKFCTRHIKPQLFVETTRHKNSSLIAMKHIRLMEHQFKMKHWEELIKEWNRYQRSFSIGKPEQIRYEVWYPETP